MIQDYQGILYPWSPRSAPGPQGWCLVARYAQNKGCVCANTSVTVLCDISCYALLRSAYRQTTHFLGQIEERTHPAVDLHVPANT